MLKRVSQWNHDMDTLPALLAICYGNPPAVASFTKEVNPRLVKRPLVFNGRLANRGLISLVKEATVCGPNPIHPSTVKRCYLSC